METMADSGVLYILAVLALGAIFLAPTLVGIARSVEQLALVIVLNLIGGVTGVGWLAALILAFGPRRRSSRRPPRYPSQPCGPRS